MEKETLRADERRDRIVDILNMQGKVKVADLSKQFELSEVTIRNDLIELERNGLLERTHGGAIPTMRTYYNMSFYERKNKNAEEKKRIAAAVPQFIHDGDTIMINSGTTTFFIANELKNFRGLKVVTNSLSIAMELGDLPGIHVLLLGGDIDIPYSFTYGDDAISQLKRYHADVLIMSIDGVSATKGLTTYHYEEAEVDRAMLQLVNRSIVVSDHTKIGRSSFTHVAATDQIDYLITSEGANEEELAQIAELGITIVKA